MAVWQPPLNAVHVTPDALDWALNHVESFGDTIFLPHAFEYKAIRHSWIRIRDWLTAQDLRNWVPRPYRRLLANKTAYSFRYVTQLDPLENLVFTSLLHEVGPQIEAIRVPQSEQVVYSWRFQIGPEGQMYDPASRWHHFNSRCLELANARSCRWVVVADIADFFPHIYLHPLEHAIDRASGHSPNAYCVMRFIRNWNALVSYGLPVGLAGSRILAEAAAADLDRALLGRGRRYCRYSDDIRIFCRSEGEAHRALEELAMQLFETHGLTLQPMKTLIVSKQDYIRRFTSSGERVELENLTDRLHDLLDQTGWEDDYEEEVDYESLPDDIREQIDRLNLVQILEEQLELQKSDPVIMSFILHRLRQLGIDEAADLVLANIGKLHDVIDLVVRYLKSLIDLGSKTRRRIGRTVIAAARKSTTSAYERVCLLSLFTENQEFDNEERFERLFGEFTDPAARRELVLAMGRSGVHHWFAAQRRDAVNLDPWSRRAFIAASSCSPLDARRTFYRSLRNGADILEAAIIDWALDHPFR